MLLWISVDTAARSGPLRTLSPTLPPDARGLKSPVKPSTKANLFFEANLSRSRPYTPKILSLALSPGPC